MWNTLNEDLKQTRSFKQYMARVKMELLCNNLKFPE